VRTEYEVDVLRTTLVSEVMSRQVETLPATATVREARRRLREGRHGAYPLVDGQGRCVGIVARGDLLSRPAQDGEPVTAVGSQDVVSVTPEDTVFRALQLLLEEEVEHLPVIAGGKLVGICTRTDVLRARRRQLESERREPGWKFLAARGK
jgi:CBS domain-containing protein